MFKQPRKFSILARTNPLTLQLKSRCQDIVVPYSGWSIIYSYKIFRISIWSLSQLRTTENMHEDQIYRTKRSGLGTNTLKPQKRLRILTYNAFICIVYHVFYLWRAFNHDWFGIHGIARQHQKVMQYWFVPNEKILQVLSWDALGLLSIIPSRNESWKSVCGHSVAPFALLRIILLSSSCQSTFIYFSGQNFNLFSERRLVVHSVPEDVWLS